MAVKAHGQITLSSVVDVKATYRYYLLRSATSAKPSKPTIFPPTGWDDVEPTYTDGSTNSLYFVDCTVFCDDTFMYSEVSRSSSYEAAKIAYNKATNAQGGVNNLTTRVTNAETNIANNTEQIELAATKQEVTTAFSNLKVGSKNLIRSSKNLLFGDYYFVYPEFNAVLSFKNAYASLPTKFYPEAGFNDYDVYWNGIKYTCSLVVESGELFLGNRGIWGSSYQDTGEPFLFMGWALTNQDPYLQTVQKNTTTAETVRVSIETRTYE